MTSTHLGTPGKPRSVPAARCEATAPRPAARQPAKTVCSQVQGAAASVVYVHCRGGRERSATVATALLAREHQLSIDQAMALARAGRPVFCPLPWQMAGLQAWAANIT